MYVFWIIFTGLPTMHPPSYYAAQSNEGLYIFWWHNNPCRQHHIRGGFVYANWPSKDLPSLSVPHSPWCIVCRTIIPTLKLSMASAFTRYVSKRARAPSTWLLPSISTMYCSVTAAMPGTRIPFPGWLVGADYMCLRQSGQIFCCNRGENDACSHCVELWR